MYLEIVPPVKLSTDQGAIIVVPHLHECMRAMYKMAMDYARLHHIPYWEVDIKIETDTTDPNHLGIIFTACRRPPQGDNS